MSSLAPSCATESVAVLAGNAHFIDPAAMRLLEVSKDEGTSICYLGKSFLGEELDPGDII